MRTVTFITLGCRLNQAEEAMFAGAFAARGWNVSFEGAADVVVLHSCAVTRTAERSTLQSLRALKRDVPPDRLPLAVVTGCAAAALPEEELRRAGADLVVVRGDQGHLCDLVEDFIARGGRPAPLEDDVRVGSFPSAAAAPALPSCLPHEPPPSGRPLAAPPADPLFRHSRALLKVQDGCDFRCSYCIVPLTRGRAVSLAFDDAVAAARRLVGRGFGEIVLTGCNLACYRSGGRDLPDLVSAIAEAAAPASATVSLGSVEPGICDARLTEAFLSHANVRRFLHLPVQSGDSNVLALAGRRYDGDEIRETLLRYRSALPGLRLGGDFITGLPGEDEAAFRRTCDLVREVGFDALHVFPFSPRQGTAAATAGHPPREVARERAARLRALALPDTNPANPAGQGNGPLAPFT